MLSIHGTNAVIILFIFQNDTSYTMVLDENNPDDYDGDGTTKVKSTKRPTSQRQKSPSKKLKAEAMKNQLLQLAIENISKTEPVPPKLDAFDTFGQYVASKLRNMPTAHQQGWAKLEIQTILFQCQMQQTGPQSPSMSMPNIGGPSHYMPQSMPPLYIPQSQSTQLSSSPSAASETSSTF